MVQNDGGTIGRFMADDWTIVGPDGGVADNATFLALVRSGALTHDVIESRERESASTATLPCSPREGYPEASTKGSRSERWSGRVFVKREGQWKCVLTHLSRIAKGQPAT